MEGGKLMNTRIHTDPVVLADFCGRHGVVELALFGSALREDFSPESDVDVLVAFAPGVSVTLFDLVDMADELSEIVGRPVDLIPKAGLKPRIRQEVLDSSQILYAAA